MEIEKQTILKFRSETGVLNKKFAALKQELDDQTEEITGLKDNRRKLDLMVEALNIDIRALLATIEEKDGKIGEKEKQIYELKKKNQVRAWQSLDL